MVCWEQDKGFLPITAHNLWKVYALPRMTYGLEIMPMTNKDKEQLEILQKKILKQIQGLPCRAANTGVYVGCVALFRQPITPTAHYSDNPLLRQPITPTAHFSDNAK
jgi:hypothetical protein